MIWLRVPVVIREGSFSDPKYSEMIPTHTAYNCEMVEEKFLVRFLHDCAECEAAANEIAEHLDADRL